MIFFFVPLHRGNALCLSSRLSSLRSLRPLLFSYCKTFTRTDFIFTLSLFLLSVWINWTAWIDRTTDVFTVELISQADITTVSAKGIRRKIETLTNSSLDHVKREFDEMVMEIYEKITDDVSPYMKLLR